MRDQSEDKGEDSSSNKPGATAMREDVDMTDEENEEQQRLETTLHERRF